MLIEQTLRCPHCGSEYLSQIELAPNQDKASEQCKSCLRFIYMRFHTDGNGNLGGIEIHSKKF